MLVQTQINSGATNAQRYEEEADFFRLMEATGPVSIKFYRQGREVADAPLVKAGYAEKFSGGFDAWRIESDTTQTIQFVTRNGNSVQYDIAPTGQVSGTVNVGNLPGTQPVSGTVNVGNLPADRGGFTQTQRTVTNASAQMLEANASRRYLLIQNKDTAGIVYVNLQGSTATVGNGLAIEPGGSLELQGYVPSGAITAIGSIASNANVISVEG